MRVFVTGATGFIGSRLVPELLGAGHTVLGLTRSEKGAETLRGLGAEVLQGNIKDLESLRKGAAESDGVIHLAFNHDDFTQMAQSAVEDRDAVAAMAEVLAGSSKPLVVTSGTALALNVDGKPSTEDGPVATWNPRVATETLMGELAGRGIVTSVVRLPQVHDRKKQGLIPYATRVAKQKGVSAYVGEGANRWPAAPVEDVARLYRLAFEKAERGAIYHAVAEEGVSMKEIAEALGRALGVPAKSISTEEVAAHFGWLAHFIGHDMPSSSAITRAKLGWEPTGPSLMDDLSELDLSEI